MSERARPSAIAQLVLARWRSFYREPGVIFWTFGFPLLLAIALGVAFRSRAPQPVSAVVIDGPGAARITGALEDTANVRVSTSDAEGAARSLRAGKADVVVEPGPPVEYRYDETRPEGRLARALVDHHLQRAQGRRDAFDASDHVVTEVGSRYIDFLIPGLLGIGLMQGGLWGVGYTIVDMRTRRLMKRLLATPMKKRDFLIAFVIVRAMFLLLELPVLLSFGVFVFGVPVRGSVALLGAVAAFGSLVFAGVGLLIASRAQNVQTASGLVNLVTLPMLITSGTFFSSARFPDVAQPFVRALPLTALNDAMRAIMLDGATLSNVAPRLLVLAAWGGASFLLSLWLFRWR